MGPKGITPPAGLCTDHPTAVLAAAAAAAAWPLDVCCCCPQKLAARDCAALLSWLLLKLEFWSVKLPSLRMLQLLRF